jgi:HEAT repeat protein
MSFFLTPNVEKMKAKQDFAGLKKILLEKKNKESVRLNAARVLGEIRDPRGVEILCSAIAGDNTPDVKEASALALKEIGGAQAFDPLITMLTSALRHDAAADALVAIGQPILGSLIERLSASAKSWSEANRVLEKFKEIKPLLDRLVWAADSEQAQIWASLLSKLGPGTEPKALMEMLDLIQGAESQMRESEEILRKGLPVLRRVDGSEAIQVIFFYADQSAIPSVAGIALAELRQCQSDWPRPLLTQGLQSDHVDLRRQAVRILAKEKDESGKLSLLAAISDTDEEVRLTAIYALGSLGAKEAVQPLIEMIQDPKRYGIGDKYRKAAVEALGVIADPRAVTPLIGAIKSKHTELRRVVSAALGKIKDPRAVEALVSALSDTHEAVAEEAVEALVGFGSLAVPPLLDKLAPERERVVKTLERIGWKPDNDQAGAIYWIHKRKWDKCVAIGAAAVPPLLEALSREKSPASVIEALSSIGDERAIEPIIRFLDNPDIALRRPAATALVKFYRGGKIDNEHKQLILSNGYKIQAKHVDSSSHQDYGGKEYSDCPSDHHTDKKSHDDHGTGVAFDI